MAGRIGAITMRRDGTILLGGAQGGIWKWTGDTTTGVGTWTPLTDGAISLATGALAVAPANTAWSTPAPVRVTSPATATSATAS